MAAQHILNAFTFLQLYAIPMALLEQCLSVAPTEPANVTTAPTGVLSKYAISATITDLVNLSLVWQAGAEDNKNDSADDILKINRFIQSFICDTMDDEQRLQWPARLAIALDCKIGSCDYSDPHG